MKHEQENENEGKENLAFTIKQEFLQEFEKTKDPNTNTVPRERLLDASEGVKQYFTSRQSAVSGISWQERGPNNVGGRTRALLFDKNDATKNTIFAGGVAGGIWKCANLSNATPTWTKISDILDNIAVSTIVQDQVTPSIMYFGTGEIWGNLDAQRGLGIWKSLDGGTSWNHLASTNNSQFNYVQNIVLTSTAIFAGTASGLKKSTDGGNSWITVLINSISDVQIAANGDIYASNFLGNVYKSTAAQQGSTGTWANVSVPGSHERLKLATAPSDANKVYVLCQQAGGNDVDAIYRTDNGGGLWISCAVPTIIDQGNNSNFTRGQAWYDLAAAVDPNDASTVIIAGVDALRSTDGGTTWNQISTWSLFSAPAAFLATVHADQHIIVYSPGSSSKAIWGTDGGIYYTANVNVNGTTVKPDFVNKNNGYNVTQAYAGAIEPTAGSNYFLAGAQDNGSQKFPNAAGVQNTTMASGGDGAFCHIDQLTPANQITSYVYNVYYRSTNSGGSFPNKINDQSHGSFINPTAYDDNTKVLYGDYTTVSTGAGGAFARWLTTGTTNTGVTVATFGGARVTNVYVSPNIADRIYFGLSSGSVVYVDNASTATTATVTGNIIRTGTGSVSGIAIEAGNENHVLITYSNYGVTSIFETTNGGTAWINDEGNLPDMPVRWVIFNPLNNDQALLATELGVWSTDNLNSTSTLWSPTNPGLANTRVDMLKVRSSDNTILAATHGRGLFTTTLSNVVLPTVYFEKGNISVAENGGTTNACSPVNTVVPVKLFLSAPATAPVTIQINSLSSSTATNGSDYTIAGNTATFPTGTTGPQTVNVTVKDDNSFEGNEYINLTYSITAGGSVATTGTTFQSHEIEIIDDESAANGGFVNVVTSGPTTTNLGGSSPVQGTQTDKKSQYLYRASELIANGVRAGLITDISFIINTKASASPFKGFTFKVGATASADLSTGFTTPSSWKVISSGDYDTKFGNNDFSIPSGFLWNGVSNLVFEFCYNNIAATGDDILTGEGTAYVSQAKKSSTVPADDGCSYVAATSVNSFRPVFTFTQTIPQTTISTQLNSTSQVKFSGADKIFFFDGSGKIILSIKNENSFDYGCTSATIDRSGTGTSQFIDFGLSNYLMNKTYRVIPGIYHPDGVYTITLYYTAAEKAGWEAATGNIWSNIQIIKTSGAISSATPANPGAAGNIEMVTPVHGTLGSDYTLSYTFSDGFSGFGAGIVTSTLPVNLLSFEGISQNTNVLVKWKAEHEFNTNYYEVQRSSNGQDYEAIGNIKSFSLTSNGNNYSLVDYKAGSVNYYRLRIVDNDGNFSYSKVVSVSISALGQKVYVSGNPFTNMIHLRFVNQPKDKVNLRLLDLAGKSIIYREFKKPGHSLEFDVSSKYVSKGVYMLEAIVDGARFVSKVVKD
ncbi:MAG: Calx-beta domain-containing protein [Ginsengibacter sp.]